MKAGTSVENLQDARNLLQTIRYWGIDISLVHIVQYAVHQPFAKVNSALKPFRNELIESLLYVLDGAILRQKRMEKAMDVGSLAMVKHLVSRGAMFSLDALKLATAAGHIDCLQYALQDDTKVPDDPDYGCVYETALANGSIACMKVLDQSKLSVGKLWQHWRHRPFCWKLEWNDSIAAAPGQLECLQFMHNKGWENGYFSDVAAASGNLACVQFIVENRRQYMFDRTLNVSVCAAAAANNRMECLQYLREINCPWDEETGIAAARKGSLRCLQYFLDHSTHRHHYICHAAALNGRLDCLQYAHSSGCSLVAPHAVDDTGQIWAYKGRFGVTCGPDHLVDLVAQEQHWDCVQYLMQHNYTLTRRLTAQLTRYGQDNLLAQAGRGCPLAADVSIRYARVGDLERLTSAHARGCPWNKEVCVAAARGGHLQCLQYAHEHGCPWDKEVLRVAKKKGHAMRGYWSTRWQTAALPLGNGEKMINGWLNVHVLVECNKLV